ncbi:hypothetical protein NBRC116590_04220 [Pelagimonas sp. KU-00592-HH]
MVFDTDQAAYVHTDSYGKADILFIGEDRSSGLLSVFPEDEKNPPNQSKFSYHSREAGPTTFSADTYHGVCIKNLGTD